MTKAQRIAELAASGGGGPTYTRLGELEVFTSPNTTLRYIHDSSLEQFTGGLYVFFRAIGGSVAVHVERFILTPPVFHWPHYESDPDVSSPRLSFTAFSGRLDGGLQAHQMEVSVVQTSAGSGVYEYREFKIFNVGRYNSGLQSGLYGIT